MFRREHVILVTGASSGIGRSIALECNAQGATVLANGRCAERLESARAAATYPERWHPVPYDLLENLPTLPDWVTKLRNAHGKLWGLVNCAGEGVMDSLQTYTLDVSRRHFDINFHVPVMLTKGFCDRRNSLKGGALLFLTSSSAVFPEKGHLVYGAAKAALATAAKVISQEMAPRGLRVHCLAPGIVDTPLQQEAEKFMGPYYREEQLARYPLGFGMPEDVAHMAAFLLSEKARWITGQNYVMGGGCY